MFFLVVIVVTVVVLLIVKDVVHKRSRNWRELSAFPGDAPLPVIGNALALGFSSDEATKNLLEMWKRHGRTSFRVSMGSEDWVLLTDPEHVKDLFSDPTIVSKSPERNAAVIPFFGKSVSTSEGERWRWARKLVLSSFHNKSNEQRLDVVNEHSEHLVQILSKCTEKEPVPLYRFLRPFMLDVLFKTLMGVDGNFLDDLEHPYLKQSGKVINIITENYFSYWRNIQPIFLLTPMYKEMMTTIKTIRETARNVIGRRKARLQIIADEIKDNNKYATIDLEKIIRNKISDDNTLIDAFLLKNLPNGDPVPEDVIDEEISFVYFTGHFTTSVTISHTLFCLAKHPDIQDQVLKEQQMIFQGDATRKPTIKDLNEMKYLEAAVKETLRLIPTVPKIGRKLEKDLLMRDGRVIPAGTTAIVYYKAMFVDEKVFPEPHRFNPDRFLENNMHAHAFLPFGGGPRSCIGFRFAWMAMKATLSNILRRFEVGLGGPGTEPQFSFGMVTESKNGISLKLNKRLQEK